QTEIEEYLNPKKEEKKKEVPQKLEWPLKGTIDGFKVMFSPLGDAVKGFIKPSKPFALVEEDLKGHTVKSASKSLSILYEVYKKSHGMLAL
ncbi:MAG: hypothetical protein WC595_06445, partial [Candidatus Nanoarchaeia archaeon]